jgi:hypothetical protein
MALNREQVVRALGNVDDAVVAQVLGLEATAEELAQAQAWITKNEALINSAKPLVGGRVSRLIEILTSIEEQDAAHRSRRAHEQTAANLVFQMEVLTNSNGEREICHIECDPTSEDTSNDLEALELGGGAWEFTFNLPASFDGTEPIFRKFERYGLARNAVVDECLKAVPMERS